MTLAELSSAVSQFLTDLENGVDVFGRASTSAQSEVYKMLLDELGKFDTTGGRFTVGAPYYNRFSYIERNMDEILDNIYRPAVSEYLNQYSTIDQVNAGFQRSYNDIEVSVSKLTAARQTIYRQAEWALQSAVKDAYVQPVKYMLMQQVTTGATIKDAQRILRNWNNGTMTDGRLASGARTPALQRYSTQIARDSIFKANAAVNSVIAKEYGLDHFIYVGGLVKDSRPLCKTLVSLRRKISLNELPPLIASYPQGLYPDTDRENFIQVCGGFSCGHSAIPVKNR
jgi:hypothetical protein